MKYKESILKSKLNAIRLQYLVCMLISLIGFQMHSQVVRVIDNKGTISEVNNNQVTTATTAPTSPLKNDIWIDTTSNTVKVWEGTPLNAWQEMASIRNWISNTNSGTYAIDHLVSYNGAIYKNITGTNTDIAPDLDSTNWEVLKSSILSDADGDTKIQVEESADEDLIRFDLAGTEKFVMRGSTIEPVNNGNSVFIGENAGLNDNLTNNQNIAIGTNTLRDNVAAFQNVAIGQNALLVNTGGHNNFALGRNSLLANTVGDVNVGLGGNTLSSNINGEGNLAIGASSLSGNISGDNNVAIGRRALRLNQSGNNNVAIGAEAGDNLISGLRNTIIGDETGWGVTTGSDNTIIGSRVKGLATDLSNNIIFSDGAGNIQLQNDGTRWQSEDELQAGSFDTAWQNNTNGGVYAVNHIAIYNGILYKNLTGVNTDTTPDLDKTNWERVDKRLGNNVGINDSILFRHNWPSIGFNLGFDGDGNDAFFTSNPSYRIIEQLGGGSAGNLQFRGTATGVAGAKRSTVTEFVQAEFTPDGDLDLRRHLNTDTFSSGWLSSASGGTYLVNTIVAYSGSFYKNKTGNNANTTPNSDTTNWEEVGGGSSDPEWVANASYAAGDVVLYNGRRFTNTTSSNTATNPAADILRWEASDLTYSRTLMPRRLQRRLNATGGSLGSITLGDDSSKSYPNVLFAGGLMNGSGTQYVFYLNQNGNVSKSGGGSWASTSDERTKKDIKDFNVGLEEVIKLRPVSFKYNGKYDTPTDEKEHVSFIAQEVEKIAPRMINKIDIPGSDAVGENALKLLENSDFVPMLVNAVKELKQKNDELEARIKALESK